MLKDTSARSKWLTKYSSPCSDANFRLDVRSSTWSSLVVAADVIHLHPTLLLHEAVHWYDNKNAAVIFQRQSRPGDVWADAFPLIGIRALMSDRR